MVCVITLPGGFNGKLIAATQPAVSGNSISELRDRVLHL